MRLLWYKLFNDKGRRIKKPKPVEVYLDIDRDGDASVWHRDSDEGWSGGLLPLDNMRVSRVEVHAQGLHVFGPKSFGTAGYFEQEWWLSERYPDVIARFRALLEDEALTDAEKVMHMRADIAARELVKK